MTRSQTLALFRASARELLWGLHVGSHEIHRWYKRAQTIPDATIRADALFALKNKRTHAHGAGLFCILPRQRNENLLRLLIAYELIWDFLDNLSERSTAAGYIDGHQLHLAIAEAVDPTAKRSDYYCDHPNRDDGGYLRALVQSCQHRCSLLPSFAVVSEIVLLGARRAQVLALNHHPDPHKRATLLRQWAEREHADRSDLSWWELSGAASAPLAILALLALAAEPRLSASEVARVHDAYSPWLSATTTMLDSYVDQSEDRAHADHAYVEHYPSPTDAQDAIQRLISHSLTRTRNLARGDRHEIIAAAMIAMYLSKTTATSAELSAGTDAFVRTGGSLTRLLLPILRLWRVTYRQRDA
jgi:tetraprenyl-beta-curcumene synthase